MDELLDINEPLRWVDTCCRWVGGLLLLLGLCTAVVAPFVDVRLVPACAAALSVVHHAVLPWIGRRFAKRLRTLSAARVLAGRPPLPEVAVPRLTGWAAVPVHLATALLVCTAVDAPAVKEVAHALAGGVGGGHGHLRRDGVHRGAPTACRRAEGGGPAVDELSTSFQVAAEQTERRLRTAGTRLIQLSILTVPIAVFVDLTLVALPAVTAAAVHLWWAPRLRRRFAERLRMVDAARVLLGRPPIGPVDLDAPSGAPVVAACALAALIAAQPGWLTANPAVLLSMAVQVPICTATYAAFLQIHADVVNRTALRLLDVSRPRD